MRTKETVIEAVLLRTREILENAEYMYSFKIEIRSSLDEVTSIRYEIDESVIDYESVD